MSNPAVPSGPAPTTTGCFAARKVIQSFRRPAQTHEPLTSREAEILDLLAKGHLTKEIADRLAISLQTVKSHLKNIYGKLHVRTRTEAVIKYLR